MWPSHGLGIPWAWGPGWPLRPKTQAEWRPLPSHSKSSAPWRGSQPPWGRWRHPGVTSEQRRVHQGRPAGGQRAHSLGDLSAQHQAASSCGKQSSLHLGAWSLRKGPVRAAMPPRRSQRSKWGRHTPLRGFSPWQESLGSCSTSPHESVTGLGARLPPQLLRTGAMPQAHATCSFS